MSIAPARRPALQSKSGAARYLGISRTTLTQKLLSKLEVVRVGEREMVVTESMDRFIAASRSSPK